MDAFVFTHGGAESLEAFNLRVAKYAEEYDVVGVVSNVIGASLVLSLTLASDGIPSPIVVKPMVMLIAPEHEPTLENALTAVINSVKGLDDPAKETMSLPLELRVHSAPGPGRLGFALLLVAIGEIEEDG